MSSSNHTFLFSLFDSHTLTSTRKVHIRRLYDVLQLCVSRKDLPRAMKAWTILARCKEVNWMAMWRTAVHLLVKFDGPAAHSSQCLEYLGAMMRQFPQEQESILKELILRNIMLGRHRQALDELDLYLPSLPFQDNPVLHIYAGLLSIFLAKPPGDTYEEPNPSFLQDAQVHLERARTLDPDNIVAQAFLDRILELATGTNNRKPESEHGDVDLNDDKRSRTESVAPRGDYSL